MGRVFLIVLTLLILLGVGGGIYLATLKPKQRPAVAEKVEPTPARLERGRYLAENVLGCFDCHSKHDLARYGGPAVGPAGAGGDCFGETEGFPGKVCTSNITADAETGLGAWSDGQIMRAIREGVDKDGKALFPMMPYLEYRALSDEDTRAVVAYMRTLPAANNPVPAAEVKFPLSFFMKLAPRPLAGEVPQPNAQDRVVHGKYLAKVSGCQFCHTPVDKQHQPLPGQDFSGGQEFPGPWGRLRSANLTPHATGLGERTEQMFVGLFKAFASIPEAELPRVTPAQNTVMPWLSRARMTEADLGAIYAFLKTVPPIDRTIEKRPPPALPAPQAAAPAADAGAAAVAKP